MLIKRSMTIQGHRTSIALEPEFWSVLEAIADERSAPLAGLIAEIDAERVSREPDQPLASAARVYALQKTSRPKPI